MELKFVMSRILCCKNVYECVSPCSIDKNKHHIIWSFSWPKKGHLSCAKAYVFLITQQRRKWNSTVLLLLV